MDKVAMGTMGMQGFQQTEQVWQIKWLSVTCLALNLQLASLACKVSHINQL